VSSSHSRKKRMKLDLSVRKGTFVGYRELSKAYQIYIPGQRQIKVCRDVFFEKEVAFRRSRGSHMKIDNETQEEMVSSPPHLSIVQIDPVEPVDLVDLVHPIDVPRDIVVG
jgi:hypothetical protein